MKTKDNKYSKWLRLEIGDLFSFFLPVVFFYGILLFDIVKFLRNQILGNKVSYSIFTNDFNILHAFIVLGTLIFITKVLSLRYSIIKVQISISRFKNAINVLIKKLDWQPIEIGDDYLVAVTKKNIYSHNERITIIFNEKYILANSISSPLNSRQLFTYGRNNSNLKYIKDEFCKEYSKLNASI